jgi:hypothetical protein
MYGFYDFVAVLAIASVLGSSAIVIGFAAGFCARDEAK